MITDEDKIQKGLCVFEIKTSYYSKKKWSLFEFQKKIHICVFFGLETYNAIEITKKNFYERFCFVLNEENKQKKAFFLIYSTQEKKLLLGKTEVCIEEIKKTPMCPKFFNTTFQTSKKQGKYISVAISCVFIPMIELKLFFWERNMKKVIIKKENLKIIRTKDLEIFLKQNFFKNIDFTMDLFIKKNAEISLTNIDCFLKQNISESYFKKYDILINNISLLSYLNFINGKKKKNILTNVLFSKILSFLDFRNKEIKNKNTVKIFVKQNGNYELIEEKIPIQIKFSIWIMYNGFIRKTSNTKTILRILEKSTFLVGKKYNKPESVKKIPYFIKYYKINTEEIEKPINLYKTFNEFFYRKLKKGARFIEDFSSKAVSSPTDCRINCFMNIEAATKFWIKGKEFSVDNLLHDKKYNKYFSGGSIAICRLAPQDYHRFHSPVKGVVVKIIEIPGKYITVNPIVVKQKVDVFTENKRVVVYIETEENGTVAFIAIGAVLVGSINITCEVGSNLNILDEIGYFAFGGSTVILIFQKNMFLFDICFIQNTMMKFETFLFVGNRIGYLQGSL